MVALIEKEREKQSIKGVCTATIPVGPALKERVSKKERKQLGGIRRIGDDASVSGFSFTAKTA